MCIFGNFDHLRIKLQSSDLFWGTKFRAPFLPLPPFIFSHLQALIMAFYGGELLLNSSSPRSGVSSQLFFFSIPLPLKFKKQRTPLMKKIQGLQAPNGATSCGIRASSSRWCSFASTIFLFCQFTLIPCSSSYSPCISSIFLWFGAF